MQKDSYTIPSARFPRLFTILPANEKKNEPLLSHSCIPDFLPAATYRHSAHQGKTDTLFMKEKTTSVNSINHNERGRELSSFSLQNNATCWLLICLWKADLQNMPGSFQKSILQASEMRVHDFCLWLSFLSIRVENCSVKLSHHIKTEPTCMIMRR